jgi:hypothetical protein
LCKVALVTVTPPTNTGASRATGVSAPVRPTCVSMASTVVSASSAGNLWAMANRGARETKPSAACAARSLTLYTTPSMSYGRLARAAAMSAKYAARPAAPVATARSRATGKPQAARRSSTSA